MATHRGGQFINKLLIVSLLSAREYLKLEYKLKAPFMATQDVRVYRSSKISTQWFSITYNIEIINDT